MMKDERLFESPDTISNDTGFAETYKKTRVLLNAIILIVVLAIVLFFAVKAGYFIKDPHVDIQAENCYSETLTIVMGDNFAPFSFENDGEYSGHDIELANEIGNRLQMNVKLEFYNWNKCLEMVRSGEADMIMSADYELPIEGISYSIPTASNPWMAFSSEKTGVLRNYADLYGKRIGVGEGTDPLAGTDLTENYVTFESYEKAFNALNAGIVDTVITQYDVGVYIVENKGYEDIDAEYEIIGAHLAVGVSSDRKELLAGINKTISEMSGDGTLDKLNKKWCSTFVKKYSLFDLLRDNPEYFLSAAILLTVALALLVLLLQKDAERRKVSGLKDELLIQNQLITHLIQEYGEIYYVQVDDEKSKDTSKLIFKGTVFSDSVVRPPEDWPFAEKLDFFIERFVVPEDRERVYQETCREVVDQNTNDGGTYAVDFKMLQGDALHNYQIRFARVDKRARLVGFVIGLRLMDKEVALLEELSSAKETAEAANSAKTAFLFNMSHDIRTPMNAILGFTDVAEKSAGDPEKVSDCHSKIKQSGNLLLALINSVLEMSRIESGKADLDEKPLDVNASFEGIEGTMQELAKKKNIDLSFEYGDIKDRFVFADLDRTNRIFINIISNAIKYTDYGGCVKVKCEQAGRQNDEWGLYRFAFEDNGIGMSEEFQKRIFDEFSRENTSTTSGVQGTGLGMSVTKAFVDLMKGSIVCESKQGEGTTFTVTLPFRIQQSEGGLRDAESSPGEGAAALPEATNDESALVAGKRVLLVEDNEMNREIARFILEEEQMVVEEADDGSAAVEMVKEQGPQYYDLILMDIQMPIMDGYEATKVIREMYPDAGIPIIALSANAFAEDKAKSLAMGMNDHIAKPINTKELFSAMSKFL